MKWPKSGVKHPLVRRLAYDIMSTKAKVHIMSKKAAFQNASLPPKSLLKKIHPHISIAFHRKKRNTRIKTLFLLMGK